MRPTTGAAIRCPSFDGGAQDLKNAWWSSPVTSPDTTLGAYHKICVCEILLLIDPVEFNEAPEDTGLGCKEKAARIYSSGGTKLRRNL